MSKTSEISIFVFWIALYAVVLVQSLSMKTQWTYDALFMGLAYIGFFSIRKWLKMKSIGLFLLGLGMYSHLAGFYGLYQRHYGLLGYDSLTHILNSIAAAWILFNFIAKKINIKKSIKGEHFIGEHRLLFFLFVISLVTLFGVCIEILEFGGYALLEEGDGMFFAGSGDADIIANLPTGYADTMMDIITNILGAIIGASLYYFLRYPKKLLSHTKKQKSI